MIPAGPALPRETVDRLEAKLVDQEEARGGRASERRVADAAARVPRSPEPPD